MLDMSVAKCRFSLRWGVVLLVAAVYATTASHGFVWDDNLIIVNNHILEKLSNIPRLFLSEDTAIGFTGYYRPMTYVTFALERALWGVHPAGYHLTNLILHITVVLLFQTLITELFRDERLAFVAALLFALHPMAGETVYFLAGGRNTLLCACFSLLAFLFHIRGRSIPALASFVAALFSKEFTLLLPVIFLVHDYRLQREQIRIRRVIPFLLLSGGYLILRSYAVQNANFLSRINLSDAAIAPYLVVRYLCNMIAPFHLRILYDVHPGMTLNATCAVVLAGLSGLLYHVRRHDKIFFAAVWIPLFLLPVINIIPLDSSSLLADRYAYFSLMGFALLLATLISTMTGRSAIIVFAAVCALYSTIDLERHSIWHDEVSFYTRMSRDAPEKFDGFQNLGMYYYRNGNIAAALPQLSRALSKSGVSAQFLIGSASVFWKENMPDMAEKSLLRAMQLEPANPEPYLMLVVMYERSGDLLLARTYRQKADMRFNGFERMLATRPAQLCREGEQYLSNNLFIPAENVFWQALMCNPAYAPALVDMGALRARQGDLADAIHYLNKAIALEPLNIQAHYNLAMVYQLQGRTEEAQAEMARLRRGGAASKPKGGLSGP